jgi:arginyl-tRNA synthetase
MTIKQIEENLRAKFSVPLEFRESRLADFETNLFFLLKDKPFGSSAKLGISSAHSKEKLGFNELWQKYQKELVEILPAFDLEFKNGFLNLYFKKNYLVEELKKLQAEKLGYFKNDAWLSKKVNVEFVSANPTGPLHLGNLAGGPTGETLVNLFKLTGAKVTREFYVNDLGNQSEYFVQTIIFHLVGDEKKFSMPENGYPGDYAKNLAENLRKNNEVAENIKLFIDEKLGLEELVEKLRVVVIEKVLGDITKTLSRVDVGFDIFSFESQLINQVEPTLRALKTKGFVKERDGAQWFYYPKHKELLGDRECVLIRSDGKPTYFLKDIAYHLDKIKRGADLMIDVWGPNHFGHVPRMMAAMEAFGYKDKLKIILYQQISLKKDGKVVKMAKRSGNYVLADEILDSVKDKDIFKVFLFEKVLNSHLDFDLVNFEKNQKQSPAFYLKYISARIHGIKEKLGFYSSSEVEKIQDKPDYSNLGQAELNLLKRMVILPYKIGKAIDALEPHFIYLEAQNLAAEFHKFYEAAPILDAGDSGLASARLQILLACEIALKQIAEILGIDLPEKM